MVTLKDAEAVLCAASVAVQLTVVVVPMRSGVPTTGVQVIATRPSTRSVAVGIT